MWEVYFFVSFDLFNFFATTRGFSLRRTFCRVTRGAQSLSASSSPSTLAKACVKKFSRHNSLGIQIINFCMIFLHILLSACKCALSCHGWGLKLFILFKNLHCDNIPNLLPLRPFRTFNLSALCITSTSTMQAHFLCSNGYWLLAAFHFQTLIFISFRPFSTHLNNFTHFLLFSLKRASEFSY